MDLTQLSAWREQLGLLPLPLYSEARGDEWILLNGSRGNFCLSIEAAPQTSAAADRRSVSWSSNVGYYLTVSPEVVEVERWDRSRAALERFSTRSVAENLEKFHSFLEMQSPSGEQSIVAHTIRTFRSLRAASEFTGQENGYRGLQAFLVLLASATEGGHERTPELGERWNLPVDAIESALSIQQNHWEALVREMLPSDYSSRPSPILDLTLRHASGALFQEAHYEASKPLQYSLWLSVPPAPIEIRAKSNNLGLHFTPPALVRTLVEESLSSLDRTRSRIQVFDPACGSGEFLREALRQLRMKEYTGTVELIGWDISDAACDMARFVLGREVRETRDKGDASFRVEKLDALSARWPTDVDLILMNPPFLTWRDMVLEQKDACVRVLQEVVGKVASVNARNYDLAHVFVAKATVSLVNGGVIGTVLPASTLDSRAAREVRGFLSAMLQVRLVGRLGNHSLFAKALVDTSIVVGKRETNRSGVPIAFWSDHRATSSSAGLRELRKLRVACDQTPLIEPEAVDRDGFSVYPNPKLGADEELWLPRPYRAWNLFRKLEAGTKVGDIFIVDQGINTGGNAAFILSSKQIEELPGGERHYFRPTVWNSAIQNGVLRRTEYVFFPYRLPDLHPTFESEEELRSTVPFYFARYLLPNKAKLERRSSVRLWWLLNRNRPLQGGITPKIVSAHFGDTGSYSWDAEGDFSVVQGHAWLLKSKAKEQSQYFTQDIGFAYLSILNSRVYFDLLSAVSHNLGGGQWDLSKRYVDLVPIPNLFDRSANADLLKELAEVGRRIGLNGLPEGGLGTPELELVYRAYGLSSFDLI